MLVVSNIDLPTDLPTIKPLNFLESSIQDFTLNINTDYRYLKTGYYVSLHAEILGSNVVPSTINIIDAYRTPILLLRAAKAGIPTLPSLVTSSVKQIISEFNSPIVIFAANPVTFQGYRIAKNRSALYRAVKGLSMNYKFAVCAQPLVGELFSCNSFFGRYEHGGNVERISEEVYRVFRMPVCKLYVQHTQKNAYLCGLQPLKKDELFQHDLEIISEAISGISENGDPLIG